MKSILLFVMLLPVIARSADSWTARADSLFALRCNQFDAEKLLADSTVVMQAIHLYEQAVSSAPDDQRLEVVWKYLQASYFKSQFIDRKPAERKKTLAQAIELGEAHLADFPNSIELNAWLGILWARWSEVYGIIAAARKGVADRVRRYAERSVELDPLYLDGGGWRLLGMLHFKVPHIPLFLSWPSKQSAMEYIRRAHQAAPRNMYNRLFYAEILAGAGDAESAKQILEEILAEPYVLHDCAIDAFIKREAAALLLKLPK